MFGFQLTYKFVFLYMQQSQKFHGVYKYSGELDLYRAHGVFLYAFFLFKFHGVYKYSVVEVSSIHLILRKPCVLSL